MSDIVAVYTDGGLCGTAPTPHGGSWAYVFVGADGKEVHRASGTIRPADFGMATVENNFLETLAIVEALEALPEGSRAVVYGDNLNSIRRARAPFTVPMNGVPASVVERLRACWKWAQLTVEFVLIGGHPTRKELADGKRADGRPVSAWNVLCDELCQARAAELRPAPTA